MSTWLRTAVLLVALAAFPQAAVAPAAAQLPEIIDTETIAPPLPQSVTERLPEPQQRHLWMPNDAPWPWNMTAAQGSWTNSNGSVSLVWCGPEVASDNPSWYQHNMRYTRWAGGARCNIRMAGITGSVRLLQWNGLEPAFQVGSTAIGTQHEVPENHGFGWQAYGLDYYTRTSDAQNLQIHLQVTLEIPAYGTGARWNIVPNACTRDANIRIIHCQLWSVPFRYAPYPCPSGEVGVQPFPSCTTPPQMCPLPQAGVQPNCVSAPPTGPCPSGQLGAGSFCVTPPPTGPCSGGQVGAGSLCVTPPPTGPCPSGQLGLGGTCTTPPPPPQVTPPPETRIDDGPPAETSSTSATFRFSSPQSATFECRLDGGAWTPCASPTTYSGLGNGNRTFEVRAKDSLGQRDSTPASRTWLVDNTAPIGYLYDPENYVFGTTRFRGTIEDVGSGPATWTFEIRRSGQTTWAQPCGATTAPEAGSSLWACDWVTANYSDAEDYEVRARLTDRLGNTGYTQAWSDIEVANGAEQDEPGAPVDPAEAGEQPAPGEPDTFYEPATPDDIPDDTESAPGHDQALACSANEPFIEQFEPMYVDGALGYETPEVALHAFLAIADIPVVPPGLFNEVLRTPERVVYAAPSVSAPQAVVDIHGAAPEGWLGSSLDGCSGYLVALEGLSTGVSTVDDLFATADEALNP